MTTEPPICMNCRHFDFEDDEKNACAAYPQGIPVEILTNEVDHKQPYKGDNGIQFQAIERRKAA